MNNPHTPLRLINKSITLDRGRYFLLVKLLEFQKKNEHQSEKKDDDDKNYKKKQKKNRFNEGRQRQ